LSSPEAVQRENRAHFHQAYTLQQGVLGGARVPVRCERQTAAVRVSIFAFRLSGLFLLWDSQMPQRALYGQCVDNGEDG
jgi:hypothetical protein